MNLPSFIWDPFDHYVRCRDIDDCYYKFKALESVCASTIKYAGTTFALIANDQTADLGFETYGKIFQSSSLGGWLSAIDVVCRQSRNLPPEIESYCNTYNDYTGHPSRATLDEIAGHLGVVFEALRTQGYRTKEPQSLNLIRALGYIVEIRNKCAHGALDIQFFATIEQEFLKALQSILFLIPFSKFVFWGRIGSYPVRYIDRPEYRKQGRDLSFWVESPLLSEGFSENIPCLVHSEDSRSLYCLNDAADEDDPVAEYVDYGSGHVIYRRVEFSWPLAHAPRVAGRAARPIDIAEHTQVLNRGDLSWREIQLTTAAIEASADESGIYVFVTECVVLDRKIEVVLYVGKTESLRNRLRSYLRVKKGYDDSRPEISRMFDVYGETAKMMFAGASVDEIAGLERAVYEVTMPEFNLIAPPAE